MRFPSTPEIKRVIAAVKSAGVPIGSITISAEGISIFTKTEDNSPKLTAYDIWKAADDAKRGG